MQKVKQMKLYDPIAAQKKIDELAESNTEFVFLISYDMQQAYIVEVDNIDKTDLLVAFPTYSNIPTQETTIPADIQWRFEPPLRTDYERAINFVKSNMEAGNSYLTNLTCKVKIDTNLTLLDIFTHTKALYRCYLKDQFVCFSPEIFIRIANNKISSFPMKGTIDATLNDAHNQLLNNKKETAEHATIVDLIRNDLSIVAKGVHVEKYRYIDHLTTHKGEILQTSSQISGQITSYYQHHLGELIYNLLPAGSITGAPKKKTMEIIAHAENYERGFYTGIMGHYKDGVLDSAVMIRFVEQAPNGTLYYKAGGGITAQSNNDDEYKEVINKIYVPIY